MIELIDGKLHQWDTGRKVKVSLEGKTVSEVHFSTIALENALVVLPYEENGIIVAEIPNILLQNKWDICVHVVSTTEDCERTIGKRTFGVCHRPKPEDYVYTETEVLTWESLDERIKNLEKGIGGADISKEDIQDAVNEYLDNNPVSFNETDPTVPDWAKQPNPPKQPDALPNPHKLTFSGAVSAEYDGSKEVIVKIPEGGSGGIPIPETAEVGQSIVVKAVDENGKPTAWTPVDLPEGGDIWRLVAYIKVTEDVTAIEITQDNDGNPFSLKKFRMIGTFHSNTRSTGAAYGFVRANTNTSHLMSCSNMAPASGGRFRAVFLEFALRGQAAHVQFCSASDNSSEVGIQSFVLGNAYNENTPGGRYQPVVNLSITAANAGYGNGTAIELWGVDA